MDSGLESSSSWPCPPIQRCIKRPASPDFVNNVDLYSIHTLHENSLSSDENSPDAGDDELPLIDDDSDSCRLTVRRDFDSIESSRFPCKNPLRGGGLQLITDPRLYSTSRNNPSSAESSLFTLHLFVTAIANGPIADDTPEKISGVLEQARPYTPRSRPFRASSHAPRP